MELTINDVEYDQMLDYKGLEIIITNKNNDKQILTPRNFKQLDRNILVGVAVSLEYKILYGPKINDLFERNAIIRFLLEDLNPYLNEACSSN